MLYCVLASVLQRAQCTHLPVPALLPVPAPIPAPVPVPVPVPAPSNSTFHSHHYKWFGGRGEKTSKS